MVWDGDSFGLAEGGALIAITFIIHTIGSLSGPLSSSSSTFTPRGQHSGRCRCAIVSGFWGFRRWGLEVHRSGDPAKLHKPRNSRFSDLAEAANTPCDLSPTSHLPSGVLKKSSFF